MKSLSSPGMTLLVMALLIFSPAVHSMTSGNQEFYQLKVYTFSTKSQEDQKYKDSGKAYLTIN